MSLDRRLQQLEFKMKSNSKQPGCDVSLFIVVPKDRQQSYFDTDSYKPAEGELEKYLKYLKDSGQCHGCRGSCAIDWAPDGFKNHTIVGECSSSSSTPKLQWMYCADAEIPVVDTHGHSPWHFTGQAKLDLNPGVPAISHILLLISRPIQPSKQSNLETILPALSNIPSLTTETFLLTGSPYIA